VPRSSKQPLTNAFRAWSPSQWGIAVISGFVAWLVMGLPTAVIENPVFGRSVEVTAWSMPVLVLSAVLTGLLVGTYVNPMGVFQEREVKVGGIGGLLSFFAIGCPVCNKLVLLALGTTGAMNYFAPVQPFLAVAGVVLLTWALIVRLRNAVSCEVAAAE
jgi:hypothetical protein